MAGCARNGAGDKTDFRALVNNINYMPYCSTLKIDLLTLMRFCFEAWERRMVFGCSEMVLESRGVILRGIPRPIIALMKVISRF